MFEIENHTSQISFDETQTIVSDLSDGKSSPIKNFNSVEEINDKMSKELSKLTLDKLKDKCKIFGIKSNSKSKKTDVIGLLMTEFEKTWIIFKNSTKNELKEECKKYKIKGINGLKKEELLSLIMNYYSENLIITQSKLEEFELPTSIPIQPQENQVIEIIQNTSLSLIEELEKQRREIETKMLEEIEKQNKQEELERQQLEEDEKVRIETEREREREKEEREKEKEEKKKKKQSIPKNVRNIVWNHYIGEDIIKHRCLCCKKVLITNTNFEVGHVLSEKNKGTHEINNLRPICGSCNHSMGTENMIDFVVKYGLYIG
jgi:5-methylcytosine-specific restriction endonuclease McrA